MNPKTKEKILLMVPLLQKKNVLYVLLSAMFHRVEEILLFPAEVLESSQVLKYCHHLSRVFGQRLRALMDSLKFQQRPKSKI